MSGSVKRWGGGVSVTISMPVEEAWKSLGDFCAPENYLVVDEFSFEGERNALHCIRYVKAHPKEMNWAREELIAVDNSEYYLKYKMLENGLGFSAYEASVKLLDAGDGKTTATWHLNMDPVPGKSEEEIVTNMMCRLFTSGIKKVEGDYHQRLGLASPL